jgi:hypothetical protein
LFSSYLTLFTVTNKPLVASILIEVGAFSSLVSYHHSATLFHSLAWSSLNPCEQHSCEQRRGAEKGLQHRQASSNASAMALQRKLRRHIHMGVRERVTSCCCVRGNFYFLSFSRRKECGWAELLDVCHVEREHRWEQDRWAGNLHKDILPLFPIMETLSQYCL